MSKPRYSPWFTLSRCVWCKEAVTYHERYGGDGRCPMCGFKRPGNFGCVAVIESGARRVYKTWWKFWSYTIEEKHQ